MLAVLRWELVRVVLSMIALLASRGLAAADPPRACAGPAERAAADERVARANDRQLRDRLAALGLTLLALPVDEHRQEQKGPPGLSLPHAPGAQQRHPWRPTRNAEGREVIEAEPFERDCGPDDSPPLPLFARTADGAVYRLEVTRRVTAREPLLVCGCAPQPVSTCGLNMRWTVLRSWTLPAGTHYAGAKQLAIETRALAKRYTRSGLQACPPVPQPP